MLPNHSGLAVALLLATLSTGCLSVGDLAHVNLSDASGSPLDAASEREDGSYGSKYDGFGDAGNEPPRLPCDAQNQCATDALCAPDGFCIPRCEAQGACIVAASTRPIGQVWVLDDVTYVKLSSTRDGAGNDAHDAELRRLESNGDLTFLAGQHDFEGLQSDGTRLYWHAGGKIWRMPKGGSVAPEALYATRCDFSLFEQNQLALFDGLALSVGSSDGQAPLRQLATLPAVTSVTTNANGCRSVLAYAGERIYWTREGTIVASSTVGESEQTLGWGAPDFLVVVPPYVYSRYWNTSCEVFRRDQRDLTQQQAVTAVLSSAQAQPGRSCGAIQQVHGDWVYRLSSSAAGESFYLDIERWSTRDLGTKQTIAAGFHPPSAFPIFDNADANIFNDSGSATFAVSSTHLFAIATHAVAGPWTAPQSSLLYRLPLPPAP